MLVSGIFFAGAGLQPKFKFSTRGQRFCEAQKTIDTTGLQTPSGSSAVFSVGNEKTDQRKKSFM